MFRQLGTLISGRRREGTRRKNEQSISSGDGSINVLAGRDVNLHLEGNVPTELIDQKIREELEKLRKLRFFPEFDTTGSSLRLGRRLAKGDLSSGSDEARGQALAWCVRFLSHSVELEQAKSFLELAKTLGDFPEVRIAEAFVFSQKGDRAAALEVLADIDSAASCSAGLMIVSHHDGAKGALSWIEAVGYTIENLDSDGRHFLLILQLNLGLWDKAVQTIRALSETDFKQAPILHHLAGLAELAPAIPGEFRSIILQGVPFQAADFRLASDADAMDARCTAYAHFLSATKIANQLECSLAARIADEYTLWLELHHPTQSAQGKKRLEDKLRDPHDSLSFVRYAIQFGIKLDLPTVEQAIEQSIAIKGGMSIEAAIACFSIALAQPTPEEVVNYITRYYDQLAAVIDTQLMRSYQIDMLVRAGLIERANEILDQLLEEGISADQESSLRWIISEAQGSISIESRKEKYEATGALGDLINLVSELEGHQHWDDLCKFGRLLFEKSRSLIDAERLVNAFDKTGRSEKLVAFLKENSDLLSQSSHLRMLYAWGLYHEGALLESRAALKELSDELDNSNYRALQVNLGIATGDWASLSTYIVDEYQKRNERSAHDLIRAVQLAIHLNSLYAKDLLFEAAAKADTDSAALASAYFIATSAGWENDPEVFQWLKKAAELSGDDGPLQKINLQDIVEQRPEWDRQESETWRLLTQGQMPIFLAAQTLNRTLIDLTLFPALANLMETDPRGRSVIPAYSGKRVPLEFEIHGKVVALDATALLTLSFLKILDTALDAFETVYIPHSTLGWLFEEHQKTTFHQPSRIANAHKIRNLQAAGVLEKFTPSTVANSELSAQVGDELAALIAEAEKTRDNDDAQHIVVRSAPVYRLSSLMKEEADLSAHATVLSGCLAIVEKLKQKGQLTVDEEKQAKTYLQLKEKPWPDQPEITDGATLYLDDLAISYLQHLRILDKLKAAGLTTVASPRTLSEANALISYESISEEVKDIIERVRSYLSSRIESGHVRVDCTHNVDELKTKSILEHPTVGVIGLASRCDVSIIDDRFLNQHANIGNDGALTPVLSTLDLLDALVEADVLSDDERLGYRTRLRRAGYFFVPVNAEELEKCLKGVPVDRGVVVETAELKAIRESVLRVRMSDWLQLPEEAPWLDRTLKTFIHVLRKLWEDGADIEEITARSNWLLKQIDVRGWAHSFVPENADNIVRIGRAAYILLLLAPPTDVQQSVVDAYWNWVEERILVPIQEQFPEVYEWLVDRYRSYVAEMTETQLSDEGSL